MSRPIWLNLVNYRAAASSSYIGNSRPSQSTTRPIGVARGRAAHRHARHAPSLRRGAVGCERRRERGPGGKYEPAGIVHKGEVVFNQRDVAMMGGPNRVNALRPTFKGYADGGIVTAASTAPINQAFAFRSENTTPQIVASWKEATELNTRIQFKEALVTV